MSLIQIKKEYFDGEVSETVVEINVNKMTFTEKVIAVIVVVILVWSLIFQKSEVQKHE